ncbi:competence protein CoiA [Bacillus sp. V5-8f]|uniref:competence protein CoiA n=1 Tax=Bacillus sp. V5-8f TaxID=2053044 RepID=UPI0015E14518|nr:competence protein CoiA family protein [Bacillus sp. V5-8f]
MLTAKNEKGLFITLYNIETKEKVLNMKKQGRFHCPCCNSEVTIKAGNVKIPHFAHKRNSSCNASSEPESEYHLLGKANLYQWISRQYHSILEAYIPEIKQRADILFTVGNKKYAIEFQCSSIPEAVFINRTKAYQSAGISPLWIVSEKNINKINQNEFSLRHFDWLFLSGSHAAPVILAYCPLKDRLSMLQRIIPFSPRTAFSLQTHSPLSNLSFEELFDVQSCVLPFLSRWREKRMAWSFHNQKSANWKDVFYRNLYMNQLTPSTLPPEIGFPVQGMHLVETAAVRWQSYIFTDVLHRKEEGRIILINEFIRAFNNRIEKGHIRLRRLPLITGKDHLFPLFNYVSFFLQTGYIEAQKTGYFKIKKKIEIPRTVEQMVELEKNFYYVHQKLLQMGK